MRYRNGHKRPSHIPSGVTTPTTAGEKEINMINILLIIGIILLVLWLLGLVSSYTLGGFVYVALVIGIILVVVWLVLRFGRRR